MSNRQENLAYLQERADEWLDDVHAELTDRVEDDDAEDEIRRLIRFVVYRLAVARLAGAVELSPWQEPPFPDYDDREDNGRGS